jgi:hypothetical protein
MRLEDAIARVPAEHQQAARRALSAFVQAANHAVRQWQYDAPADGPMTFPVTVTFTPEGAQAAPLALEGQLAYPPSRSAS